MSYIPNTDRDLSRIRETIGVSSTDEVFADIPANLRLGRALDLPDGMSELEVVGLAKSLAERNRTVDDYVSFMGAGAYDHFIPSAVSHIVGRSEFYTSYTPYQAEMSQGTLQAIYEFQSMVCSLTGMDVANASLYDGASAVAEAAILSINSTGRRRVAILASVNPEYRQVLATYIAGGVGCVDVIDDLSSSAPLGSRAIEAARGGDDLACLVVQTPDFFGRVFDISQLADECHTRGSLLVVAVDPISLGLLKPPGALGADIVVGEGQALGNPLSFGGPYLGFMGVREALIRYMPGRICGATVDAEDSRGFVLTLQAREQHIRRERAYSNICTNQALNALSATVYLALMGKQGLRKVATLCVEKSHYLAEKLTSLPGVEASYDAPFFKEFALKLPVPASAVVDRLRAKGILAGVELGRFFPEMGNCLLVCVTEKRTKAEMDRYAYELEAML